MQIWIYFQAGVGGDGLANLFEHANNVDTIDGQKFWRVHRYVDGLAKFWAPSVFPNNGRGRSTPSMECVDQDFVDTVLGQQIFTIVTDHKISQDYDSQLPEIFCTNRIKILLKSRDLRLSLQLALKKNLLQIDQKKFNTSHKPVDSDILKQYDYSLFIEDILNSWEFTQAFTKKLGLDLDKEHYDNYKKIVSGKLVYTTPGIEFYESYLDQNQIIQYKKV